MLIEDLALNSGIALAVLGLAAVVFLQSRATHKDQIQKINFRARVAAAVAGFLYVAATLNAGNAPGSWGLEWIAGAFVTALFVVALIISTATGAAFKRRLPT